MPRKSLIRDAFFPYHVTNRTLGQRHYPLCMDQLWQLYSDQLCQAAWAYNANIHAFVLMSNHYHLLLSTPSLNIDEIIQAFQSQISLEISKRLNSKDWCFDTRYRWTLLKNRSYFYNTYRYVYQNPLRAGLAKEVSEYKYSTFHGRAGYSKLSIPLWAHPLQDDIGLENINDEELWLNSLIPEDQLKLIRKGMRHYTFGLSQRDKGKLKTHMSKR